MSETIRFTAIFVNLPVADVGRATRFYEAIGGSLNPMFSDEKASCIVLNDNVYFMLLHREFFQSFLERPVADTTAAVGAISAVSVESREDVDAVADAGVAAGGIDAQRPVDMGFMYSRQIQDPDGNVLEFLWMDSAAAQNGPPTE
ncbi:MAG TPA: VOC family protein [Microbacteriaceae bacterium]|nr:VOC family protein [Microbacteriaceae bacterium]